MAPSATREIARATGLASFLDMTPKTTVGFARI
jgi:hypothetical protein